MSSLRLAISLLLALTCFSTTWASDASSLGGPATHGLQGFARVMRISGEVTAGMSGTGSPRQLHQDDVVYVGETVRASVSGEALLKSEDAGYMAVRPAAGFLVEKFAANHNESDHISIRILQGGLRVVTGWIGKLNAKGYQVATPTATIGIRGTDHEPYVVSREMVVPLGNPAGTYDKVNSGGTTLEAHGKGVDIDPGKVGFVRLVGPNDSRALITLIMPVLLEKVPGFYVPGQFDAELDSISAANNTGADAVQSAGKTAQGGIAPTPELNNTKVPSASAPGNGQCNPNFIARDWVDRLDRAIASKDAAGVIAMFAPDTPIRATVATKNDRNTSLVVSPEEFAKSVTNAISALSDYTVRRLNVSARRIAASGCNAIAVESRVIEQGKSGGKPFRFETIERYRLEIRDETWLATQASTRQR